MYNMLHSPRWPGMWKWEIMQSVFARIRFIIRNRAGGPEGAGGIIALPDFGRIDSKPVPSNYLLYHTHTSLRFSDSPPSLRNLCMYIQNYMYWRSVTHEKFSSKNCLVFQQHKNIGILGWFNILKLKFVESIELKYNIWICTYCWFKL